MILPVHQHAASHATARHRRKSESTVTIAGATAAALLQYLAQRGADGQALLAAAGLPRDALGERYSRIPVELVAKAFELASLHQGDPLFGIHFGEWYAPPVRHPCNIAISNAPDLRTALICLVEHRNLIAELSTRFSEQGDFASVSWTIEFDSPVTPRHVIDFKALRTLKHIRNATGPDWLPLGVYFTYENPGNLSEYHRVFGPNVCFNQPENSILIKMDELSMPIENADPDIFNIARESVLNPLLRKPDGYSPVDRVRHFVGNRLEKNTASLGAAARHLDLTPQRLRRMLKKHDTCFQCIVNETRQTFAQHYLAHTELPCSEVALLLGFSDQSVFTRAVKRWFGKTPMELRRQTR